MAASIELAQIEYGTAEGGRRTALLTYKFTAAAKALPCAQDFKIEVIAWDGGDANAVIEAASDELHRVFTLLAQATKPPSNPSA